LSIGIRTIAIVCGGVIFTILAMLFFVAGSIGYSIGASIIALIFVGVGIVILIR